MLVLNTNSNTASVSAPNARPSMIVPSSNTRVAVIHDPFNKNQVKACASGSYFVCHPERQRRVATMVVEILRFAQNDMRKYYRYKKTAHRKGAVCDSFH